MCLLICFKKVIQRLPFCFSYPCCNIRFFFETSKYFATFFAENCTSINNDYFDQESSELLLSGKTFIDL